MLCICTGVLLKGEKKVEEFSQADIDSGHITYAHHANHTTPDCFMLMVSEKTCLYNNMQSVLMRSNEK